MDKEKNKKIDDLVELGVKKVLEDMESEGANPDDILSELQADVDELTDNKIQMVEVINHPIPEEVQKVEVINQVNLSDIEIPDEVSIRKPIWMPAIFTDLKNHITSVFNSAIDSIKNITFKVKGEDLQKTILTDAEGNPIDLNTAFKPVINVPPITPMAYGGKGGVESTYTGSSGKKLLDVALYDSNGNQITSFGGAGGTSMVDDAAFTAGTTQGTPMFAMFDNVSPDSVDEGDGGVVRMSANRNLFTTIRDAAGNERGLNVDANGQIGVSSVIPGTGATSLGKAEDQAHADGDTGVMALAVRKGVPTTMSGADGDYEPLQINSGRLWTSTILTDGNDTALIDSSGRLQVDIANISNAVTNPIGAVGPIAHDATDSGNPIKVGAKAETSPKGATLVADGDRTDMYADVDGMLMVKLNTSGADIVSERVTDTSGTSTAFANFSAVASTKNYVTSISLFNSSATAGYVDFRNGTGGSILWTMALPAGGGSIISSATPLFKTSANTALAYDVSGALSTVYISVSGYQSKV